MKRKEVGTVGGATGGQVRQLIRKRLDGWESRQEDRERQRKGWHEYYRVYRSAFTGAPDKSFEAAERQVSAMGSEVFEVGALQRGEGDRPEFMLLRVWDKKRLMESIPWLRYQNWYGSHIYVRPRGESNLTLVDDLSAGSVATMREEGFQPAVVVQTSPGNFQAWVKHPAPLDKESGTGVARELAQRFGGDVKAAAWRHFGRLAGFRNTKARYKQMVAVPEYDDWRGQNFYRDLDGQWIDRHGNGYTEERLREMHAKLTPRARFPFVRLVEACGVIAPDSERLVAMMKARLDQEHEARAGAQAHYQALASKYSGAPLKGIEQFRADARYGGDGTRADMAYAVYAVSHGVNLEAVRAALRSRDLSHKGNEKRQTEYLERTIKKAVASLEQGRGR